MAQAYKCDRCGNYFDQLPIRAVTGKLDRENFLSLATGTDLSTIKILHICLKCHQQLVEWFDAGHGKEEKKLFDYDSPYRCFADGDTRLCIYNLHGQCTVPSDSWVANRCTFRSLGVDSEEEEEEDE